MKWIYNFQLFLFDFDGLLVNTEEIHFMAYKRMLSNRGFKLSWSFDQYCNIAHYSSDGLQIKIYEDFPKLKEIEPVWKVLYSEKKQAVIDLINEGLVQLMPGSESLLNALSAANINRCVVTHSPDELISAVRKQNPILNTIPNWLTREHYKEPKPNPECYLKAIEKLAKPGDKIVGFEDTPRGLMALMGTKAKSILVCQTKYPEIPDFLQKGVVHYSAFTDIPEGYI